MQPSLSITQMLMLCALLDYNLLKCTLMVVAIEILTTGGSRYKNFSTATNNLFSIGGTELRVWPANASLLYLIFLHSTPVSNVM
jgi:hypothetical protein